VSLQEVEDIQSLTGENIIDSVLEEEESEEEDMDSFIEFDSGADPAIDDEMGVSVSLDDDGGSDRSVWLENLPDSEKFSLGNSNAEKKFHDGIQAARRGDLNKAEALLREAVRTDSSGTPEQLVSLGLVSLGRVLLGNPQYDEAATIPVVNGLVKKAMELSSDNSEATRLRDEIASRYP
jgi:hypothetical protein